jgi:hypothetical protein
LPAIDPDRSIKRTSVPWPCSFFGAATTVEPLVAPAFQPAKPDGASTAAQPFVSEPGWLLFLRVTDSAGRFSEHELLPFEVHAPGG